MSGVAPEVKGSVLRGVLRDAKDRPGGIVALMERIPEEKREEFFGSKIYHGFWYSYEALAVLFDAYREGMGSVDADAIRATGARMAQRDMTTLLKAYSMVVTPSRLAAIPVRIWEQRFRNAGRSDSERGDRSFRFTISDFPEMHPMLCEILTGYGQQVGLQKTKDFKNTHDRCIHRGDPDCSWLTTW